MIDKGLCSQCNRKVMQTLNDICMYCGAPLPPEQQFSESEKLEIKTRQKEALEEQRLSPKKSQSKSSDSYGYGGLGDSSSSDAGGFD